MELDMYMHTRDLSCELVSTHMRTLYNYPHVPKFVSPVSTTRELITNTRT